MNTNARIIANSLTSEHLRRTWKPFWFSHTRKRTARWPRPRCEALTRPHAEQVARRHSSSSAWSAKTCRPRRTRSPAAARRSSSASAGADFASRATPPTPRRRKRFAARRKATVVIAPATSRWNRVLPGVAHRLGGRADTHVTGVAAADGTVVGHALVLPPAHGSRAAADAAAVVHRSLIPAASDAWKGAAGTAKVENGGRRRCPTLRSAQPSRACSAPAADAADHPARRASCCSSPARAGRRNRPTARRTSPEAEKLILEFLNLTQASLGSSKSLVDLERRRPGGAAVHVAPEPDRPDRLDAASSERAFDLLSRRRTARGRLAVHQRAPRHQPRPELRLGARQSRRALRRRRLRGDAQGQRAAGGEEVTTEPYRLVRHLYSTAM